MTMESAVHDNFKENIWTNMIPDYRSVLLHIGESFRRMNYNERAKEYFDQAIIGSKPGDIPDIAYLLRGIVHHRLKDHNAALDDFSTYEMRNPDSDILAGYKNSLYSDPE